MVGPEKMVELPALQAKSLALAAHLYLLQHVFQ